MKKPKMPKIPPYFTVIKKFVEGSATITDLATALLPLKADIIINPNQVPKILSEFGLKPDKPIAIQLQVRQTVIDGDSYIGFFVREKNGDNVTA